MSLLLALLLIVAPPCPSDDGGALLCAWDASVQGNGTGADFAVIGPITITEEVSP